ncbi:hypothetical protein PENSPDRAFT_676782 [Peniophora sp. CONT]|nr:hypothetical protein PENSPDRAFT_676782 [Peniophora sp. CONT]
MAQDNLFPATPLADLRYPSPSDAPYKADPSTNLARGPQYGYNKCDASTESQGSLCQTMFVDSLEDFCLWGPPLPNSSVGNTEGEMVAWCTKAGHGTRVMPAGTLLGAQLLKAPDYVQITGLIDQTKINIAAGDYGGELDPHGQDLRGNPIGGLMYSTQFSGGGGARQVIEWTKYAFTSSHRGAQFCIKICDPAGRNPGGYCQNRLDRIGCAYNVPSKYTVSGAGPGEFESCASDDMDIPGEYVVNGQTLSYSQPPESAGPITSIPFSPRVPASSNCVAAASAALYTDAPRAAQATAAAARPQNFAQAIPGQAQGVQRAGHPTPASQPGRAGAQRSTKAVLGRLALKLCVASALSNVMSVFRL